jgi:uncharacterized protein (TIGR00369 family)
MDGDPSSPPSTAPQAATNVAAAKKMTHHHRSCRMRHSLRAGFAQPVAPPWHHVPMIIPTPAEVDTFVAEVFPAAHSDGYRCESLDATTAIARWHHDESTLRPGGLIAGPVQFQLADIALWFMTFSVLGLAPMAVTSNMTIDFLRPASGGDLIAGATLLRAGRTKLTGRVDLWVEGAADHLVAHATGGYQVLPPPS